MKGAPYLKHGDDGYGAVGTITVHCPTCGEDFHSVVVRIDSVTSKTNTIGNEKLIVKLSDVSIPHICRSRA